MTGHRPSDKLLRCSSCGDDFVFSAGEQELNEVRGAWREPAACPRCRKLLGRS